MESFTAMTYKLRPKVVPLLISLNHLSKQLIVILLS